MGTLLSSAIRIVTVQDYINADTLKRYDVVDINVYQANIFHTKMLIKGPDQMVQGGQRRNLSAGRHIDIHPEGCQAGVHADKRD